MSLRAPFPWFGGKSRVAGLVWDRFGDPANYVEPFAGSLAVLLARPTEPRTESVNDRDAYLSNFWRATQAAPDEVARFSDWPVSEADLHARHRWLVARGSFRERMLSDPEFYDARVAGWWVWGLCQWIGSGWCSHPEWTGRVKTYGKGAASGPLADSVAAAPAPWDCGDGPTPSRQLPHLGDAGRGLHRKLPHLGNAGRGLHRKLPHLGDAGRGILEWLEALSSRLRRVRIACGDWTRVLGPSVTERHGITAVFLDPPYSDDEHSVEYAAGGNVAAEVREWAVANGDSRDLRIALCGYEGEHDMPGSWQKLTWKARGGYGSQGHGVGRENSGRERIWFSPHCLGRRIAGPLFAAAESPA